MQAEDLTGKKAEPPGQGTACLVTLRRESARSHAESGRTGCEVGDGQRHTTQEPLEASAPCWADAWP